MLKLFCRRVISRAFGSSPLLRFGIVDTSEPDFKGLKESFLKHKDMIVFNELIKASNNTVDNINYFRIYQLLEENQAEIKHFEDFFLQVDSTISRKSDNIRMLLAKVKAHVAKQHEKHQNYYDALNSCEQALEVLEQSLIPPVMLYYQIYRYEGFIHHKMKNNKEAYEILEESVRMISKVIQHSEDHVNSNINCKNQAKACAILAELDPANEEEWVEKCFDSWQDYEGNKYELPQYAESILAKARMEIKRNPKKAEQLLTVSAYQFKIPELKEYLNLKKQELLKTA